MRTYEVVYIAAPNTSEDDLNKLNAQVEAVVNEKGGKVAKIDVWGRRKLAYPIGKYDEGVYVVVYIDGSGNEIAEVERRLRVSDLIIRHQTVRTDEDLKRAAKLKAKRKAAPASSRPAGEDEDGGEGDGSDDSFDS